MAYSLAGSFTFHGLGMFLKVAQLAVSEDLAQEEITIVVTEPPVGTVETPPEETPTTHQRPAPNLPFLTENPLLPQA